MKEKRVVDEEEEEEGDGGRNTKTVGNVERSTVSVDVNRCSP